jgi:hypothetical protein
MYAQPRRAQFVRKRCQELVLHPIGFLGITARRLLARKKAGALFLRLLARGDIQHQREHRLQIAGPVEQNGVVPLAIKDRAVL